MPTKFQIKNRLSLEVQFEYELPAELVEMSNGLQLGFAICEACESNADLSYADLRGAYLSGADISGADLSYADLSGAYLRGTGLRDADLRGADLSDAYLRSAYLRNAVLSGADLSDAVLRGVDMSGAVLSGADLGGAVLSGADLGGAVLRGVDMSGAVLRGADMSGAVLRGAVLRGADLRGAVGAPPTPTETDAERLARERTYAADYRTRHPDVPVVGNLDAKILAAIEADPKMRLRMGQWHVGETTHNRAGWAVHLAGQPGYDLERRFGPERAGGMIYRASVGYVPDFFAGNRPALKNITARAAEQVRPEPLPVGEGYDANGSPA